MRQDVGAVDLVKNKVTPAENAASISARPSLAVEWPKRHIPQAIGLTINPLLPSGRESGVSMISDIVVI
jgi:hypothetical protein